MKKLSIFILLGFMLLAGSCHAYKTASLSCTANTSTIFSSAVMLGIVSVGNSEATVQRVDFWDSKSGSGTYLGSIAVPAKSTRTFSPQIRITSGLVVFCSGAHLTITTGYESSGYGHYPYGVMGTTTQNTVYPSPGELVGFIMSNWNSDTGYYCVITDGGTIKAVPTCPAADSIYVAIDRIRFNVNFKVKLENANTSIMLIRRWN